MTTDMNPEMAPACIISDRSFKVPRVDDKDYIIILLNLCMKNGVRIVIPTIDTELQVLRYTAHIPIAAPIILTKEKTATIFTSLHPLISK